MKANRSPSGTLPPPSAAPAAAEGTAPALPTPCQVEPFVPVPVRARHDGWSPNCQLAFVDALAASGCVKEAAGAVGKSVRSAYALRARADALDFRCAWDAALDHAMRRLADAAASRAIEGVSVRVFYRGEQVGERRHFDERLTMFLLRLRDPYRFGKPAETECMSQSGDATVDLELWKSRIRGEVPAFSTSATPAGKRRRCPARPSSGRHVS